MNTSGPLGTGDSRPMSYQVQVRGHLANHWSDWLGGFTVDRQPDDTTILTGTVVDQTQLHGILAGFRDVGVELLTLHAVTSVEPRQRALARPLHTKRLTLREATADDARCTWVYRHLPEVNEWLFGCPHTYDDYRVLFADPDRLTSTVVAELRDGTIVGDLMLRRRNAWSQAEVASIAAGQEIELGWVLDPVHTRQGYATEAVGELLRHGFQDLGVHRITADCFTANVASWRLMERLGMRREAHTRGGSLHRSGQWLDSFSYALLADEWPTPRCPVHPGITSQRTSQETS